jgi:RNA polymerase sigma-70 factor (ECF subfamily)
MPVLQDESQLVAALLGAPDDPQWQRRWNGFVLRYQRLVSACILRTLKRRHVAHSQADIDDLAAELWLLLLRGDRRKLRQYDPTRGMRLSSYLALLATNLTRDHLRTRQAKQARLTQPDDTLGELPREGDGDGDRDVCEALRRAQLAQRALAHLSVQEQEFVVEAFHAERPPRELARRLGLSTNTIYARKFKLRAKLAELVAAMEARD